MSAPSDERMVPKVHPLARLAEADDPYTLHATPVTGDPEVMLRCLVQEYAWMGWGEEQILALFHDPGYPVLNGLRAHYGEAGLRARLGELVRQTGVFQFQATVQEAPEPEDEEPELIQLGVRITAPK
jgi:hypothetical protein